MIFLIDYDRTTRQTIRLDRYDDHERRKAQDERLRIELDLLAKGKLMEHEVLILGAVDQDAARRTHSRYFLHLPKPAESVGS